MPTLAQRERVAEGRVRGFCAAATGTAKPNPGSKLDQSRMRAGSSWTEPVQAGRILQLRITPSPLKRGGGFGLAAGGNTPEPLGDGELAMPLKR